MAKFRVDDEGNVLDLAGQPLIVNDEPVKLADIDGAKTQNDIDHAVKTRAARRDRQLDTLRAQANRTPELEHMLEAMEAEKAEYQAQSARAMGRVNAESAAEMQRIQAELDVERAGRVQDHLKWTILAAAGNKFVAPDIDVVPHLLAAHKREEKTGSDGKGTGEFLDLFKMRVKNDKGEVEDRYLPADEAVAHWIEAHPHHARASGISGSGGGGSYGATNHNRRSQMTEKQKADFVSKNGREAYQKLPE